MKKILIFITVLFTLISCVGNTQYGGAVNNVDSNSIIRQEIYNQNTDNLNSIQTSKLHTQYVEDDTVTLSQTEFLKYCSDEHISVDLNEWHNNIENEYENGMQYSQYTTFKNDTVYICTVKNIGISQYKIIKRIIK